MSHDDVNPLQPMPVFRWPAMSIPFPSVPMALVLHDHYLIEQMANFNRERIPRAAAPCERKRRIWLFEVTEDVVATPKPTFFSRARKPT
ncbi:hypothetical protein WDV93_14865 [Pantoea ananatis]